MPKRRVLKKIIILADFFPKRYGRLSLSNKMIISLHTKRKVFLFWLCPNGNLNVMTKAKMMTRDG